MLRVVRVLEWICSGIAAFGLLAMIVVTVVNALGRTWLGSPIYAATEVTAQWFLPLVVLLAIPGAQVHKEHYIVSIVTERLGHHSLALTKGLGYVGSAAVCCVVAWFGYLEAVEQAEQGATAGITTLPVFPFYFLVPIGFVFAAVVFACDAVLACRNPAADLNTGTGVSVHDDAQTLTQ